MEQTLAERLLERFTPDELATVRAALARIEARAKTPPKSSEPENVPTPASDSVKGEKDRHGRLIVKREGHAMVVKTDEEDDGLPYLVVDADSRFYMGRNRKWIEEAQGSDSVGLLDRVTAYDILTTAAATPLPTANPVASAKETEKGPFWAVHKITGKMNAYATKGQRDFVVRSGAYWEACQ